MENKQNWMLTIIGGLLSYVIVGVISDRRNEKLAEKFDVSKTGAGE